MVVFEDWWVKSDYFAEERIQERKVVVELVKGRFAASRDLVTELGLQKRMTSSLIKSPLRVEVEQPDTIMSENLQQ